MARGSNFLKAMVGLVTGSAVGWAAHDRFDKSSISDSLRNYRSKVTDENENVLGIISPLPGTKKYQPVVPWDSNWDRRDPKFLVKPSKKNTVDSSTDTLEEEIKNKTPKVSRHLLLIRHGQYNESGSSDALRMLTSLGMEQADLTGHRLQDLGHPYTTIIHSSMKRAIETAAIIHKHLPDLPIVQCDLLREGAPWPPEPPSRNWRPEYKFYQDGARIEAAFRKYFHRADPSQQQDSYEVIVCHANVIRYFVCRALQLPPEAWLRMSLNHGSITWVTIRPSGLVGLRGLGDAGYMPSDKISVV